MQGESLIHPPIGPENTSESEVGRCECVVRLYDADLPPSKPVQGDSKKMSRFGRRTPSYSERFLCIYGGFVLENTVSGPLVVWGVGFEMEMTPLSLE